MSNTLSRRSFVGGLVAFAAASLGFKPKPAAAAPAPFKISPEVEREIHNRMVEQRLWTDLVVVGNAFSYKTENRAGTWLNYVDPLDVEVLLYPYTDKISYVWRLPSAQASAPSGSVAFSFDELSHFRAPHLHLGVKWRGLGIPQPFEGVNYDPHDGSIANTMRINRHAFHTNAAVRERVQHIVDLCMADNKLDYYRVKEE